MTKARCRCLTHCCICFAIHPGYDIGDECLLNMLHSRTSIVQQMLSLVSLGKQTYYYISSSNSSQYS